MKRRFIAIALGIFIVAIGAVAWNAGTSSQPVLEFVTYVRSGTNNEQLAYLSLRNTSSKPIWLIESGKGFPLKPEFLVRPTVVQSPTTNIWGTNITVSFEHFFMRGEKVLPGKELDIDFPLARGETPELAGVSYYIGDFKDGNDLIEKTTTYLNTSASLSGKIKFYWDNFNRKWKAPQRYEVWCSQPLSFQAGKSTNSTK